MDSLAVDAVKFFVRTANDAVRTNGRSLRKSFNANSGREFAVTVRSQENPAQERVVKFKSMLHFTRHTQMHDLPEGQYYDLSGMNLSGVNFQNAKLRGADFSGAIISKADFTGADLDGANLKGVIARSAVFKNASLKKVHAPGAVMTDIEAEGADISGADFTGTNFNESRLYRVTAKGAVMDKIRMRGEFCWMSGDFTDASFRGSRLGWKTMVSGTAKRADFTDAYMRGVSMSGVSAPHAKFVRTNLTYTSLASSDLTGCDFSGAKSNICTSFDKADMTDALYMAELVSKTNSKLKSGGLSPDTINAAKNGPARLARISRTSRPGPTTAP